MIMLVMGPEEVTKRRSHEATKGARIGRFNSAAVIRLSKSGRAVRRGTEVFYDA